MQRRVLYFVFQAIHKLPPCIAEVCMLKDMGIEVAVLTTGCADVTMQLFESKGIPCHILEIKRRKNRFIQKIENFFNYGSRIRWFVKKYWTDDSVLWVGSEQSIMKMWPYMRRIHPMIVNTLEFYEAEDYQRGMKKIAPQVDVLTACEPHRAQYMVEWWGLTKTPYILPNKPYARPGKKQGEGSTPELREAIAQIKGKKILLYQGYIKADRNFLPLAQALAQTQSDYYLVLCGNNDAGIAQQLQDIYAKTLYLGNFAAPSHMEITPYATIGIAYYEDDCINNRYCAPNKIYEYAGCGVPMLCNAIPGLTETVGKFGAAECVDFCNVDQVIQAIHKIDSHYERYSAAATQFYSGTDNTQTMQEIVEDAFSRTRAEKK